MLETLDVFDTLTGFCTHILPMIVPGPRELSLRSHTKGDLDPILSLSSRSNITKLYISAHLTNHVGCLSQFLVSFKNLRALAIDFLGYPKEICDTALNDLVALQDPESVSFISGWDKLDRLWLIGGNLDVEYLKDVIGAYPIKKLILTNVNACPEEELQPHIRPFVEEMIVESELNEFDVSNWYNRI